MFGDTDTGAVQVTLGPGVRGLHVQQRTQVDSDDPLRTYRCRSPIRLPMIRSSTSPATGVTPTDFSLQDHDKFGEKRVFERIAAGTDVTVSGSADRGLEPVRSKCLAGVSGGWPEVNLTSRWAPVRGRHLCVQQREDPLTRPCSRWSTKVIRPMAHLSGFDVQGSGVDPIDEQFDLDP